MGSIHFFGPSHLQLARSRPDWARFTLFLPLMAGPDPVKLVPDTENTHFRQAGYHPMTEPKTMKQRPATELDGWFAARPGERPMLILAGPCVLESSDTNRRIAHCLAEACGDLGLPFAFKASFDKANRSSTHSDRGPGIEEGLEAFFNFVGENVFFDLGTQALVIVGFDDAFDFSVDRFYKNAFQLHDGLRLDLAIVDVKAR